MESVKRESETYSKNVIETLFDNLIIRKYCMGILSRSIIAAHAINPSSWSVTLFQKKIRLNVGPVEVLVLRPAKIYLVTSDMSDEINWENFEEVIKPPDIYYNSISNFHQLCYLTSENILEIYPKIEGSHIHFIQGAAKKRKRTPWYKSFSAGVIKYLNITYQDNIPYPAYYNNSEAVSFSHPEEIIQPANYYEGSLVNVNVNYYERNIVARNQCIEIFGNSCRCCGFNFEKEYGEIGRNFIHIHHRKPLSEINSKYKVDPKSDLIPVCPNCHSMLHKRNPPYSIEELIKLRKKTITK